MKTKALAILMAMVLALAGFATLAEEGQITVQGVGVVRVDADRAQISMGVREVAVDVATAQATVNEKMDAVIAALKELGVGAESITTSGIGIYPNYDYSEDERITSYSAYNSINVMVSDVENVGAYIDAAFAAGANSLDYVDFSASDTAEASDKALTLAVESAKAKAQVLADAAGLKLGDIVEVRDVNDYYDTGAVYARTEDVASGATNVLPSQQAVSASVILVYDIAD